MGSERKEESNKLFQIRYFFVLCIVILYSRPNEQLCIESVLRYLISPLCHCGSRQESPKDLMSNGQGCLAILTQSSYQGRMNINLASKGILLERSLHCASPRSDGRQFALPRV